jgi:hypothetical protein
MLTLICFLLAAVFAGLAAIVPNSTPALDRTRMLAAAFTAFVIPLVVHAGQHT